MAGILTPAYANPWSKALNPTVGAEFTTRPPKSMTACLDQGPDAYLDGSPCVGQANFHRLRWSILVMKTLYVVQSRRQTLHGALDPGNANRSNLPAERIDKMLSMLKEYTSPEQHTEWTISLPSDVAIENSGLGLNSGMSLFCSGRLFQAPTRPSRIRQFNTGNSPQDEYYQVTTLFSMLPSERSFSAMNFLQDEYSSADWYVNLG